jgi:heme exporter protein A
MLYWERPPFAPETPVNQPFQPFRLLVEALGVDRGGRRVIEDIDFEVAGGEAILVTGPNGVGKSTLLRALAGLGRPAKGSVRFLADGVADSDEVGPYVHYLGHRDAVKPALTVGENLAFWQDFLGADGGAPVELALDAVGLADLAALPAAYLSAGQRRRLAIARLIAVRRPLWLLDEPTAALDAASEANLVALMAGHVACGGAIVAATHLAIGLAGARPLRLVAEEIA